MKELQQCPEFNGWTNKPTWFVKIWIDNNESSHNEVVSIVKESTHPERALMEYVDGMVDDTEGMISDIIDWTLAYVDWSAIVKDLKKE